MRAFIASLFWAAVGLAYAAAYGPEALEPGHCHDVVEHGHNRVRCEDTGRVMIARLRHMLVGAIDPKGDKP